MANLTTYQLISVLFVMGVTAIGASFVYYLAIIKTPEAQRSEVTRDMLPLVTIAIVVAAGYGLAIIEVIDQKTRSTHLHILGITGSGKSKFMEHLLRWTNTTYPGFDRNFIPPFQGWL